MRIGRRLVGSWIARCIAAVSDPMGIPGEESAMRKGPFREDQILAIVRQLRTGRKVTELSREHGVSRASIYVWKAKYDGHKSRGSRPLRELEEENRRLKQLIGELCLEMRRPVKTMMKRVPGH